MVRSRFSGNRGRFRVGAALALVAALGGGAVVSAQKSEGASRARRLDALLDGAATLGAGTYALKGAAAEPAKPALPVVVQADVLRGTGKTVRVPIAIGSDVPQAALVRLRVISRASGSPRVVTTASGSGPAGHLRLVHEFNLTPGEYELHAAVGYETGGAIIAGLSKSTLTVPDVWERPLAVTPIVLADAVAPNGNSDSAAFRFGPTAVTPTTTARFQQNGAVNVAFRIFNWTADPKEKPEQAMPDVSVEYLFYEKTAKRVAFFNKLKPQRIGTDKLAQTFEPRSGMVTAGVSVPLVSFPFGDFQLKVRVTDNRSKRSTEQQVNFTVAP